MKLANPVTYTNTPLLLLTLGKADKIYAQPWSNEAAFHSDDPAILADWLRSGRGPTCSNDTALVDAVQSEINGPDIVKVDMRTCAERHDAEILALVGRIEALERGMRALSAQSEPEDHTEQLIGNRAWLMTWTRFRRRCEVLQNQRAMDGTWAWLRSSSNRKG